MRMKWIRKLNRQSYSLTVRTMQEKKSLNVSQSQCHFRTKVVITIVCFVSCSSQLKLLKSLCTGHPVSHTFPKSRHAEGRNRSRCIMLEHSSNQPIQSGLQSASLGNRPSIDVQRQANRGSSTDGRTRQRGHQFISNRTTGYIPADDGKPNISNNSNDVEASTAVVCLRCYIVLVLQLRRLSRVVGTFDRFHFSYTISKYIR